MLGINPIAIVESELRKLDLNHDGVPDALEALNAAEKACEVLVSFVSKLNAADVQAILLMLPPVILSKLPPGEVESVAAAIVALPAHLNAAEEAMKSIEAALK